MLCVCAVRASSSVHSEASHAWQPRADAYDMPPTWVIPLSFSVGGSNHPGCD